MQNRLAGWARFPPQKCTFLLAEHLSCQCLGASEKAKEARCHRQSRPRRQLFCATLLWTLCARVCSAFTHATSFQSVRPTQILRQISTNKCWITRIFLIYLCQLTCGQLSASAASQILARAEEKNSSVVCKPFGNCEPCPEEAVRSLPLVAVF